MGVAGRGTIGSFSFTEESLEAEKAFQDDRTLRDRPRTDFTRNDMKSIQQLCNTSHWPKIPDAAVDKEAVCTGDVLPAQFCLLCLCVTCTDVRRWVDFSSSIRMVPLSVNL